MVASLATSVAAAALASRFAVGLVFVLAAVPKLAAPAKFERTVASYQLLPKSLSRLVAVWLPRLELVTGGFLLTGIAVPVAGLVSAAMLMTFSLAVATNLLRGRSIDCGCGTGGTSRQIGWGLVAGDLALAGLAGFASIANPLVLEPRALHVFGAAQPISTRSAVALFLALGLAAIGRALVLAYADLLRSVRLQTSNAGGNTR